jgi:hypothetical protein
MWLTLLQLQTDAAARCKKSNGHEAVVRVLLDAGADLKARDK